MARLDGYLNHLNLPADAGDQPRLTRRIGHAAFMAGVLLTGIGHVDANVIKAKSVSLADVASAIASARDGDTVTVPAGTASWAARLDTTKGITLQGATTILGASSTPNVTDATIIQDDTPRTGIAAGIIKATVSPHQSFRLTGFTFRAGAVTKYSGANGAIHVTGICPSVRIDHCHFDKIWQSKDIWISGSIYGVADHCIVDCLPAGLSFLIWHETWGGQTNGNGSWADAPDWGSEKFFFIEDNTINGSGPAQTSGTIDAKCGARYVARYNTFNNAKVNSHGTQAFPQRGVRLIECYNNTFNWTIKNSGGQLRGGTMIEHDNKWSGLAPPSAMVLTDYRQFNNFSPPGGANGSNPWDVNDTEGNGTNVPRHKPYLYLSGTHSGGNNFETLVVADAGWSADQWVGYEVTNIVTGANSVIRSNTRNTITAYIYTDTKVPFRFNAGDKFAIYKLLTALDQPGRGRSDMLKGANPVINSTAGTAAWPHNALEPCYSWNNRADGKPIGFSRFLPTIQEDREFYNQKTAFDGTTGVGVGTLADRPKSCTPGRDIASAGTAPGVAYWATDAKTLYVCIAPNTWSPYYQPYTYPHPLVSGSPTADSSQKDKN